MIYRGYEIAKFYSNKPVSNNVIREYYQAERDRIDRTIRLEEIKKQNEKEGYNPENFEDGVDTFLKECGL